VVTSETQSLPGKPNSVTVAIEDRNLNEYDFNGQSKQVVVSWEAERIQEVSFFLIEFKNNEGTWVENVSVCDGKAAHVVINQSCKFSMDVFWTSGYFYKEQGEAIEVRVSTGNSYGFSMTASPVENQVKV
jgi:hypothetical protein